MFSGSVYLWGKYTVVTLAANLDGNEALCIFNIYVQCKHLYFLNLNLSLFHVEEYFSIKRDITALNPVISMVARLPSTL